MMIHVKKRNLVVLLPEYEENRIQKIQEFQQRVAVLQLHYPYSCTTLALIHRRTPDAKIVPFFQRLKFCPVGLLQPNYDDLTMRNTAVFRII